MSLLQEMETYGLADCEQNRKIIKESRRIERLLKIYLPVFNDQHEPINELQAIKNGFFIYWCSLFDDRRNELSQLLRGLL